MSDQETVADKLRQLQIGYVPISKDMKGPGDRRRFCHYANGAGFSYEVADPSKKYDIVYVTYNADLAKWIRYKKKHGNATKLIFELVDSYLFEQDTLKSRTRGIANFFSGKTSKIYLNYKNALHEISRVADAVVCSTPEQQKELLKYNDNVHISLDIFEDEIPSTKADFDINNKVKLVWEGLPYTVFNILSISDILNQLKDQIELHVITDLEYYRLGGRFFKQQTRNVLSALKCPVVFHEWKSHTFSSIITSCDIGIIPIQEGHRLVEGKPENKLILFWLQKIPVITGNTAAYQRVMKDSGIELACSTRDDWVDAIAKLKNMKPDERMGLANVAWYYANQHYSQEQLYHKWTRLFDSVLS